MFNEQIYNSNLPINYVLEEESNSNYLVIVFSGFNSPKVKIKHSYNYNRTLSSIRCNKLFILDNYGPRGSYYLGENMGFEVETAVISLITNISSKLKIPFGNIIAAGSSKGGSAALYFGLKYNLGYIISGAPQTKIADYINVAAKDVAQYMLGVENREANISKLNNIIFKQLDKEIITKILILTSENDVQYTEHVKPLINEMEKREINFSATVENKMENHGEIAKYFPPYLINSILKITDNFEIKGHETHFQTNGIVKSTIEMEGRIPKIKFVLKNPSEIICEQQNNTGIFSYQIVKPGSYELYAYFMQDEKIVYSLLLGTQIVGLEYFQYSGYNLNIENNILLFKLNIEMNQDSQLAFYVLKDQGVIEKFPYSQNKELKVNINQSGKYQVMFFIKTKESIIVGNSNYKAFDI
jgi:hypothetical protein